MAANDSRAQVYVFGDCQLDTGRCVLRRGDAEVRLRPKSFDVLEYLVIHAGRLVSKRELLDAVWGRRAVTEDSVTQCIVEVRRAIGSADGGPCLRTLPRRGYLLDVTAQPITCAGPQAEASPAGSLPRRGGLQASARAAAGVLLAVALLSGRAAWQDAPPPPRTSTHGTVSLGAWDAAAAGHEAFELGIHLFHRRLPGDLAAAERQLHHALSLDPAHANAWTALAGVYAARGFEEHGDESSRLAEQRDALERALRIEPANPEALVRLSRVLRHSGDTAGAAAAVRAAIGIAPDHPLVLYARASEAIAHGRLDEAVELRRRAVQRDPLSAIYRINLGHSLLGTGRYEEALAQLRRARLLAPQASLDSAIARALVAADQLPAARLRLQLIPDGIDRDQLLAMIARNGAEADAAESRLAQRADSQSRLLLAEIAAYRGARELALGHLEEAVARAAAEVPCGKRRVVNDALMSPFLSALRTDERWPWREERDPRTT